MRATYHFLYANIDVIFLNKKITQKKKKLTFFGRSYTSPFAFIKWIRNVSNLKRQFASMLTVLEIQTTPVSLWKLQKIITRITTLTAYKNLTASPLFEKKLWLLPLSERYKGKEIIVYISMPYITFPETSTNNALFPRI